MKLSIIIPTLNEVDGITSTINQVIKICSGLFIEYEILIIDDRSTDGTIGVLNQISHKKPMVKPIINSGPRSLGSSIGKGLSLANGQYLCVLDADLTHSPSLIPEFIKSLENDVDLAMGSRFCKNGGGMPDLGHAILSRIYNQFIKIYLRLESFDNLSGFFCIKKAVLQELDNNQIFFGYGDFYFRLVYFVQNKNFKTKEIPIRYSRRTHDKSKSKFIKLFFYYTLSLFRFKKSVKIN